MQFGILPLQLLQSAYMQFGILPLHCSTVTADCRVRTCSLVSCHCSTVTTECVHAVWYPAIALQLLQSAYMQFGILPLQYSYCRVRTCSLVSCHCSTMTAECMQFGILPLQYGDCRVCGCSLVSCHCSTVTADCRVRTCSLVSCHFSKVTAECVHAVCYPAIAILLQRPVYCFWRADFHGQGTTLVTPDNLMYSLPTILPCSLYRLTGR
jgi:hypothetical protein